MRRLLPLVILLALMLPGVVAAIPPDRWDFEEVVVTRTRPAPTLLASYDLAAVAGQTVNHLFYQEMRYRPRGFGERPLPDEASRTDWQWLYLGLPATATSFGSGSGATGGNPVSSRAFTFGALPDPFGGSPAFVNANPPIMMVKAS